MSALGISRPIFKLSILISTFIYAFLVGHAAEAQKPVFVKGICLDPISSNVMSSLKEEIRKSSKYRLVRDMYDEGQMDVVLTINVSCTERTNVAAIATVFGAVKCFGTNNCHHAIDGASVRANLCSADATPECGRELLKAFDDYVINPIKPTLDLGHN